MDIIAFITIAAAVLLIQAWIFRKYALRRLEYDCRFSTSEAYEGDEIKVIEIVHNGKLLPVPWLKVDIHTSRWLEFAKTRSYIAQENRRVSSSFLLRSFQKTTREWKAKCLKRGVFEIQSATLVSGDLLGIKTISKAVDVNACLTVYPALVDLQGLFMSKRFLQGDVAVKRWIIDDPFLVQGAREYQPNDPLNRVHWPATARQGTLMVRKHEFTSQMNVVVLLNIQSMENEYAKVIKRDIIEFGIKVSATLLNDSLNNGVPFRFGSNAPDPDSPKKMLFSEAGTGNSHLGKVMELLARLELANLRDFHVFLDEISEHMENCQVCVVTAFVNENISDMLDFIMERNNSVSIYLLDPLAEIAHISDEISLFRCRGYDHD
jgi:uncharacterized protein (DUF58 family)